MVQHQPLEHPRSSDNCRVGDGVDELDVALLDALHLNPLASFEELGAVLDVSPVTAARRWRRLVSTGRAWVSSAPGPQLPIKAALFEAECGKGTYVRALARDLGRILGCFGHICALRRTLVGPFGESDMIPLEQLEALCDRAASGEGSLADALLPVETALDDIPALAVTRADAARLHRGQAVLLRGRDAPNCSGTVYVTVAGRLLALAEIGNGELIPKRVFNLNGLTASPARNNESA